MSLITRTVLSRTLLAGVGLSLLGAKGCFGGDVSLGSANAAGTGGAPSTAGNASMTSSGGNAAVGPGGTGTGGSTTIASLCRIPPLNPGCLPGRPDGYNYDPTQGKCLPFCLANALFTSLEACQSTCEPQVDAGAVNEAPLTVDASGHVTSSADLGVSGPFYPYSDGTGTDGVSANGDCEAAGHSEAECAKVVTPPYSAPGVIDWSVGGLLCTSGTVERVIDSVGTPGALDYAHMWGAGLGFNFSDGSPAYDASAHGVIGMAFDLDFSSVPPVGMRIDMPTPSTVNEPRAWSPLKPGHNVFLFQDVRPLSFYVDQSAFDPTQILSVQFHVPTSNVPTDYAFCIHNLKLILGTPPTGVDPSTDMCPPSLETDTGFAYDASQACVSPYSSVLGCSPLDNSAPTIPAAPVVPNLPCAHRLSDGALFIALGSGAQPLDWKTLPAGAWSHLSPSDWAECSADEAALLAAAPACPIIPL